MKIGIIGDIHWSQYSSIIRKRGEKYSQRLENCIQSINWAEELTANLGCQFNVYMGDFFDKPDLNAEEISALREIKWNDLDKYLLVGNHEMSSADLKINSTCLFELLDNYLFEGDYSKPFYVVDEPYFIPLTDSHSNQTVELVLLPYVLEEHRKPIKEYLPPYEYPKRVLLTHNDLKGIQMGSFLSQQGFSLEEIRESFDLCINGHIHNGGQVSPGILNVGNLTGQNFSEDASRYDHTIFVLDTDTLVVDVYSNPHAFNFYKEEWLEGIPFPDIFKPNSVLTVSTTEDTYEAAKEYIKNNSNILESRILLKRRVDDKDDLFDPQDLSVDHFKAFQDYVLSNIDGSETAKSELEVIFNK